MTPNFALDLSEDGIELLHRAPDGAGWYREGRVEFASDDIAEGLAKLRARALELEGEGFSTKLILPSSQLLFTSVPAGTDVAATLEERTPYRIDQLSFDTSQDGDETKIVAVALETLGEAEGFIGPHGLNPIGFTAKPEDGRFVGEPMLGGMLAGNDSFAVDTSPVRVIDKPAKPIVSKGDTQPVESEIDDGEAAEEFSNLFADAGKEIDEDKKAADDLLVFSERASTATQSTDGGKTDTNISPAAFSSRRQGLEKDGSGKTGEHISKLSARIAVPNNAPKLGSPADAPSPKHKSKADATTPTAMKMPAPPTAPGKVTSAPAVKAAPVIPAPAPSGQKTPPPAALAAELAKERDPLARLAANERRGKPRFLGLIMTAILLVCLGLAALLSSFVLPDDAVSRFFGRETVEETDVAVAPVEPVVIEEPLTERPVEEEIEFARLPIEEALPEFEQLQEFVEPEPAPVAPLPPAEMTEAQAQTAYAVSGIWQRTDTLSPDVLRTETLDELYVASLDPNPAFEDAPALITRELTNDEAELVSFTRPPPPGIIFDIDERGLVRAKPEGTLNPDGITVYLGRPPVAAVPRPGGETENDLVPETTAEPEAVEGPALSDEQLRLSAIRPVQRPNDLQERRERATLGGLSRPELANIRPQQRPVSAQAQAQAIARALLEVENSDAESVEAALVAATRQAVSISRRAQQRPGNFAAIVRAARATPQATQPARVQTASASTASAATRSTGPAVARSSRINPTGPVSGRVARAATESNAIALGDVALVGVFGTSSNRRALVRMPNGRFKKVSIGDRVDGGRVAAIDGNSLRYTRGGRTITLQMPNS